MIGSMMNQTPLDGSAVSAVERALSSVIDLHGPSLLREPDRLKVYLDHNCSGATREIALVMAAVTEGVPQAMLSAHYDDHLNVLLPQLVTRLTERAAIEPVPATWAVRAWAHALAISSSALDCGRIAETHATTPNASQRSSAAEVLGIGTPVVRKVAPPPMQPEASAPPALTRLVATTEVAADEHPVRAAIPHPVIEPAVTSAVAPEARAAPIEARADETDEPRAEVDDGFRAEATAEIANVTAIETRVGSTASDAIVGAHRQAPLSGRHGRPLGSVLKVAAAIAAVVVVVVAIRWGVPQSTPIKADSESVAVSPQKSSSTAPALQPEGAPAVEVASRNRPVPLITTKPAVSTSTFANNAEALASGATTVPPATAAPQTTPMKELVTRAAPASTPVASPHLPVAKAAKSSSVRSTGARIRVEPPRAASAAAPTAPASSGCTRSTCGSVVAAHAIDDDSANASGKSSGQAARSYEITIRMDDRSIHTLTQSVRWQPGARVQMAGTRFVQIGAQRLGR